MYNDMTLNQLENVVERLETDNHYANRYIDILERRVAELTAERDFLSDMADSKWALAWIPLNKKLPEPGSSYAIWANYGGMAVYDIAFYEGKSNNGDHKWVLSNIEIDSKNIISWASIVSPINAKDALDRLIAKTKADGVSEANKSFDNTEN